MNPKLQPTLNLVLYSASISYIFINDSIFNFSDSPLPKLIVNPNDPSFLSVIGINSPQSYLIMRNNTFRNYRLMKQGIIGVERGNLRDINSVYQSNTAIYGGSYFFKDAKSVVLTGITAVNNSAEYGGAVYAEDSTDFEA